MQPRGEACWFQFAPVDARKWHQAHKTVGEEPAVAGAEPFRRNQILHHFDMVTFGERDHSRPRDARQDAAFFCRCDEAFAFPQKNIADA